MTGRAIMRKCGGYLRPWQSSQYFYRYARNLDIFGPGCHPKRARGLTPALPVPQSGMDALRPSSVSRSRRIDSF